MRKLPTLRGRTVVTMFYENSTRTRVSFEIAGKWMSADTINVSASGSSVGKGESLRDTAATLAAIGADCIVVRHPASGAAHRMAHWADRDAAAGAVGPTGPGTATSVVNAGDGTHEHPTQALLDAATVRDRLGGIAGRRIGIVGDVLHSRVARSNVFLLATLGAEVVLVAPPTLLPVGVEAWPCRVGDELEASCPALDAVMMLRVQAERMHGAFFPSSREYAVRYGLSERRAALLPEHAVVLHPGPMVRGMEIAPAVADAPSSAVLAQVQNGVHVRMAVLYHLLAVGGGEERAGNEHDAVDPGARPYGEGEPVDVLVRDGVVAEIGPGLPDRRRGVGRDPRRRRARAAARLRRPAHPPARARSARSPRPSRPARPPPRSAATPRSSRCPTPTRWPTPPSSSSTCAAAASEVGLVDVHPVGAVTVGLAGERMAELGTMAASRARVRMFSDDGRCVHDPVVMRRALEYASSLDAVIAQHAEDHRLTAGAQAHEGVVAARLGLAGWPATAEETIVARDCALAREAGARLHVCHVSSARTVDVLRAAKAARRAGHRRGHPAPPAAHRRGAARLRPRAQGQPAAAHRRRHRGDARRRSPRA